jgi:vacuolar-type H+-ATPase subunit H
MEKDILSQVITAEKELQQCLDSEKVKAREWLELLKKECEEEFIREEQRIKELLEKSTADAVSTARAKAGGIVSQAAKEAERLERVPDETLSGLVAKQINRILPG